MALLVLAISKYFSPAIFFQLHLEHIFRNFSIVFVWKVKLNLFQSNLILFIWFLFF